MEGSAVGEEVGGESSFVGESHEPEPMDTSTGNSHTVYPAQAAATHEVQERVLGARGDAVGVQGVAGGGGVHQQERPAGQEGEGVQPRERSGHAAGTPVAPGHAAGTPVAAGHAASTPLAKPVSSVHTRNVGAEGRDVRGTPEARSATAGGPVDQARASSSGTPPSRSTAAAGPGAQARPRRHAPRLSALMPLIPDVATCPPDLLPSPEWAAYFPLAFRAFREVRPCTYPSLFCLNLTTPNRPSVRSLCAPLPSPPSLLPSAEWTACLPLAFCTFRKVRPFT